MTVETDDTLERYTISGTGPYAFTFRIFDEDDLTVTALAVSGVDPVTLTVNSNYTVAGVNDEDGGTITLINSAQTTYAGYTLDIRSNVPVEQPTSIKNQGTFAPVVHEKAFDRLSRQVQDLARKVRQAFRYPDNVNLDAVMTTRASWLSKYLYVNSSGVIEPASSIGSTALTQALIGETLYPRTEAEIAASVTPVNYYYPELHIYRYGTNTIPGTTDMSSAWTSALAVAAYTAGPGGEIFAPHDTMLVNNVAITIPQDRTLSIKAYGCRIVGSTATPAYTVTGGNGIGKAVIHGMEIDHAGNANATFGVDAFGSSNFQPVNCLFKPGSGATYGCIRLRNTTAANNDTGCFWTTVQSNVFYCSTTAFAAVILQGAANATTILNNSIRGSFTHGVLIQTESGQTYVSNGSAISFNKFEGPTNAIRVIEATGDAALGLRINNNRAETCTNFLNISGSTTKSAVPTLLSDNTLISSVTNYVVNTNSQYVNNFDFSITPTLNTPPHLIAPSGPIFEASDSTKHALVARVANTDTAHGFALQDGSGNELALLNWAASGKIELSANAANGYLLYQKRISGISGNNTRAENLRGSGSFSAATTATVTFPTAEPDNSYQIFIASQSDPGGRIWAGSYTTSGFTVNCSASNSSAFVWLLIR